MDEETPRDWRAYIAYYLMGSFVFAPGIGTAVALGTGELGWFGLAVYGACCGIVGWLLGRE